MRRLSRSAERRAQLLRHPDEDDTVDDNVDDNVDDSIAGMSNTAATALPDVAAADEVQPAVDKSTTGIWDTWLDTPNAADGQGDAVW